MKNSTRKVVILENLTSPYIHQAIIVLNDYNPMCENKVIYDAEKIVDDYLRKNRFPVEDGTRRYKPSNCRKKHNILLGTLLMLGIFALTFTVFVCVNM